MHLPINSEALLEEAFGFFEIAAVQIKPTELGQVYTLTLEILHFAAERQALC